MFPRHSTPCVCQTECQLHRQPAATSMHGNKYAMHQVCNAMQQVCHAQTANNNAIHAPAIKHCLHPPSRSLPLVLWNTQQRGADSPSGRFPLFFAKLRGLIMADQRKVALQLGARWHMFNSVLISSNVSKNVLVSLPSSLTRSLTWSDSLIVINCVTVSD